MKGKHTVKYTLLRTLKIIGEYTTAILGNGFVLLGNWLLRQYNRIHHWDPINKPKTPYTLPVDTRRAFQNPDPDPYLANVTRPVTPLRRKDVKQDTDELGI